jgi:hypothetical protein
LQRLGAFQGEVERAVLEVVVIERVDVKFARKLRPKDWCGKRRFEMIVRGEQKSRSELED